MYCFNCMNEIKEGNYCYHCMKENTVDMANHHLSPGTVLHNKYVVGNVLGEGGFGITYIGIDRILEKRVAIKEFFPSGNANRNNSISNEVTVTSDKKQSFFEKGKNNFLIEARSLAKYDNEDGVVDVVDCFQENNTAYIVMDYLEGTNLRNYLKENGVFKAEDLFGLMFPIMKSLERIHNDGIIHRDISPDNIMYLKDGTLKLMDFGSARYFSNQGNDMSVVLKEGYAPEEQYRKNGVQGPWTDVYGLCATIYKCITNTVPEDGLDRIHEDNLKKPSELGIKIPESLEKVLMYGLSVFRENRCQSMNELMSMTQKALSNNSVSVPNAVANNDINKTRYADEKNKTIAKEAFANNGYNMPNNGYNGNNYAYNDGYANPNYTKYNNSYPQQTKKSAGPVVALVLILILLVAGISAIVFFLVVKPDFFNNDENNTVTTVAVESSNAETKFMVKVPDVEGKKYDDAEEIIKACGLKCQKKYEEDSSISANYVISQSPLGGKTVEEGDTVTIYISKEIYKPQSSKEESSKAESSKAESSKKQESSSKSSSEHYDFITNDPIYYCCASEYATLREKPDRSSSEVEKLPYNTPVQVLGIEGDFYYVRTHNNEYGYVLSDFLSPDYYPEKNYDDGNPD